MTKHTNDVRALSADTRYLMPGGFTGLIDDALAQAKSAPDHGLAEQYVPAGMSRSRAVLLQHLNLLPSRSSLGSQLSALTELQQLVYREARENGATVHEALIEADGIPIKRNPPMRAPSLYSLEYAMARWPRNFS